MLNDATETARDKGEDSALLRGGERIRQNEKWGREVQRRYEGSRVRICHGLWDRRDRLKI